MAVAQDRSLPAPLWVLDSAGRGPVGAGSVLAARFGRPFRRIRDVKRISPDWQPPALILCSGIQAGLAALSLRQRLGTPVVCCDGNRLSVMLTRGRPFDAALVSGVTVREPVADSPLIPVLGPLTYFSRSLFERARCLWRERLEHLPEPRVAVILDTLERMTPAQVEQTARYLGETARAYGGSLLLSVSWKAPPDLAAVFMEALGGCYKLVWRAGEPDDDPTPGFIGCADAVVVYSATPDILAGVAAADVPVFLGAAPGRMGAGNRLARTLLTQGCIRLFDNDFSPWPRERLDEAERVCGLLKQKFGL